MGNVPICYRNIKLLYFPHDQFLYYRLLGREKEQKKKIWHMFYNTNYHILQTWRSNNLLIIVVAMTD